MSKNTRISPFFISVIAAVALTVLICVFSVTCYGSKIGRAHV